MKLQQAIRLATGKKVTIQNIQLSIYNQTAKTLCFWLFNDTDNDMETYNVLDEWLISDQWELKE